MEPALRFLRASSRHIAPARPSINFMNPPASEDSHFRSTKFEDGTHASRCIHCFSAIALKAESLDELDRLERRHICPEKALAQLRAKGIVPRIRSNIG